MSSNEKSDPDTNKDGLSSSSSGIVDLAVKPNPEVNDDSVGINADVEHLEDDINDIGSKLSSLTINSLKTEDSLASSVALLTSRGPSPRCWKRERKTPFSYVARKNESAFSSNNDHHSDIFHESNILHCCGGGILPNTASLSLPELQTLTSKTFCELGETLELSSFNILNGTDSDSSGIPSPLNCSYGSPTSSASLLSPSSVDSRPDSGYGGFDLVPDNFSEIVSKSPLSTPEISLPLQQVIQSHLTVDSSNADKHNETKKINELKEMLKDAQKASEKLSSDMCIFSEKAKSEELNERFHDIEELIHNDTAKHLQVEQQLISHMIPQNNFITQRVNQEIQTQRAPIILQVVVKRNPDNQKRYLPILPKTAMPVQEDSSQKRIIENVPKKTVSLTPAKQNLEKSLDQERKNHCHKLILQKTNKENSFIREDPKTGTINLHSFIIQHDKENAYILMELTKKWNTKEKWIGELEKKDKFGKNPLHYAVLHNEPLLVDYLLECGVNPLIKDIEGNTALHFAADCGDTHFDVVHKLCSFSPYAINVTNNKGRIPLHSAVYHYVKHSNKSEDNRFKIILELLTRGSKLSAQDNLKKTPLHLSVHARNLKLIKILCENAIDTNSAINLQDINGCTALHEIAALDINKDVKIEMIIILLTNNAISTIKDNSQQRASDRTTPFCPNVQECLQWEWSGNSWRNIKESAGLLY